MTRSGYFGHARFPRVLQFTSYTCGPCSVLAILRHYGRRPSYSAVKKALGTDADGTNPGPILRYLRRNGLIARPCSMNLESLEQALRTGAVALVYVDGDHVAVVYGLDGSYVHIADPSIPRCPGRKLTRRRFLQRWDRHGIVVKSR